MKKDEVKRMFKAIQDGDSKTLKWFLDTDGAALESLGEHNKLVRDKTPLMFAMQCRKLQLAQLLLDRGANAAAEMGGGPKTSALSLCIQFAYCDAQRHDEWICLATRLIDAGADPNTGIWVALSGYGPLVPRTELIRLVLERGADPDQKVGNSGNTVRELVQVNRDKFPPEVLDLFRIF